MNKKIASHAVEDLIKKIKESRISKDILHFILFGSLATGQYSEDSDIDILCVVKREKENLYPLLDLACQIEWKYNCQILFSLLVIDAHLYKRIQAGEATLSESIKNEGKELWAA